MVKPVDPNTPRSRLDELTARRASEGILAGASSKHGYDITGGGRSAMPLPPRLCRGNHRSALKWILPRPVDPWT
jgi:hypothetical protein